MRVVGSSCHGVFDDHKQYQGHSVPNAEKGSNGTFCYGGYGQRFPRTGNANYTRPRRRKAQISQEKVVKSIRQRFGMSECNPVYTTGTGPELSVTQPDDNLLNSEAIKLYQAIVGSVVYLGTCRRFDIVYAVSQLTRAMSKPAKIHMTAAKHLLRYLKGSPYLSIEYTTRNFRLKGCCDTSWGANPDNRRSTSGYLFFLSGGLVSFTSTLLKN